MGFIRDWWVLVWWGEAVGERSGCDRFRRVWFGMAVMDGQCVDVLGPVRYEEAVEEFNG